MATQKRTRLIKELEELQKLMKYIHVAATTSIDTLEPLQLFLNRTSGQSELIETKWKTVMEKVRRIKELAQERNYTDILGEL